MIPEKRKRSQKHRVPNVYGRGLLLVVLLSMTLLPLRERLGAAQLLDVLLIGIMLCCTLYLLYQGSLWLLAQIPDEDDQQMETDPIRHVYEHESSN